jgi:hypothetical protein
LSEQSKHRGSSEQWDELPLNCFVSHSNKDELFVERFISVLARHGIDGWYSSRRILPGQQWHDEIGRALARCDWFLLILTPDAVESRWVKHELLYALDNAPFKDGRIIPLLYRTCDWRKLSFTLGSFQMIDFRKGIQAGYQKLLRVWNIEFRKKS